MVGQRLKELRKSRGLKQFALGRILNTTQQNISKIENEKYEIPIDMLIKVAQFFNVTTDYLLGLSEVKRNFECQMKANKDIDQYYEIFTGYNSLNSSNQKTLKVLLKRLEEAQKEEEDEKSNK